MSTKKTIRVGGVKLDPEITEGLVHAGDAQSWKKFWLRGPKKPVIIKTRIGEPDPDPDQLYDMLATFRPKTDPRGGGNTDYWEIKLYPSRENEWRGTVRLHCVAREVETEIRLDGVPLAQIEFDGVEERCLLYVEPDDVTFDPFSVEREREIIWEGIALIQVSGDERQVSGAVRVEIDQGEDQEPLVIYDHRQDRLSSWGRVEQIRQSERGRTYEFYNVWEADSPGDPGNDTMVLSNHGLISVAELATV